MIKTQFLLRTILNSFKIQACWFSAQMKDKSSVIYFFIFVLCSSLIQKSALSPKKSEENHHFFSAWNLKWRKSVCFWNVINCCSWICFYPNRSKSFRNNDRYLWKVLLKLFRKYFRGGGITAFYYLFIFL